MASGLFALFDDIAVLMDDIASMGKMATEKTVGILGDDLAVNAQKASGFVSSRELPVIWSITKGSFINKLIILPIAFLLSAFVPWIIAPILLMGGAYLAYEGAEKIYEWLFSYKHTNTAKSPQNTTPQKASKLEEKKIKSAIKTDFILSIEIIFLVLGTVATSSLVVQIPIVIFVAILATVGVYGIVALIVRIDDLGYMMIKASDYKTDIKYKIGKILVSALPKIIRTLTVIGVIAMLLVAGDIYMHNIYYIRDILIWMPSLIGKFIAGAVLGILMLGVTSLSKLILSEQHKKST